MCDLFFQRQRKCSNNVINSIHIYIWARAHFGMIQCCNGMEWNGTESVFQYYNSEIAPHRKGNGVVERIKKTKSERASFVYVYACAGAQYWECEKREKDDYYYIHIESVHRLFVYRPLSSIFYVYLSLGFMFTHSFISHHQMWHSCTYIQTNICQNQPAAIIGCVQRLCLCAY